MEDYPYTFVIYDRPEDYPRRHVCRRFSILTNPPEAADKPAAIGTLKECRAAIPAGLDKIERDPADILAVVETWA